MEEVYSIFLRGAVGSNRNSRLLSNSFPQDFKLPKEWREATQDMDPLVVVVVGVILIWILFCILCNVLQCLCSLLNCLFSCGGSCYPTRGRKRHYEYEPFVSTAAVRYDAPPPYNPNYIRSSAVQNQQSQPNNYCFRNTMWGLCCFECCCRENKDMDCCELCCGLCLYEMCCPRSQQ